MPYTVGADSFYRSAFLDSAIKQDQVVIADIHELPFQMPPAHIIDCEMLAFFGCRAMHDNLIYLPHFHVHV